MSGSNASDGRLIEGTLLEGRYEIGARIGRGGFGSIYRAHHTFLRRPCAVKVLKPELSAEVDRVERFFSEARAASGVRHPNIVDVFDMGYTRDGLAFYVMELLEGVDLRGALKRDGPLPWARARAIALEVCGAMSRVHRSQIIHRDLKPANIFLVRQDDGSEQVKILDFGIAKILDHGDDLTRTGEIFGTPRYMAPEHLNAGPIDHRVDIYALGVILFEILTGRAPFRGRDPMQVLAQILSGEPPSLRGPSSGQPLPEAVEPIVLRAMHRDPAQRFPSMSALAHALDAVGERDQVGVEPPRAAAARPRPLVVGLLAAGLLVPITALALFASQRLDSPDTDDDEGDPIPAAAHPSAADPELRPESREEEATTSQPESPASDTGIPAGSAGAGSAGDPSPDDSEPTDPPPEDRPPRSSPGDSNLTSPSPGRRSARPPPEVETLESFRAKIKRARARIGRTCFDDQIKREIPVLFILKVGKPVSPVKASDRFDPDDPFAGDGTTCVFAELRKIRFLPYQGEDWSGTIAFPVRAPRRGGE